MYKVYNSFLDKMRENIIGSVRRSIINHKNLIISRCKNTLDNTFDTRGFIICPDEKYDFIFLHFVWRSHVPIWLPLPEWPRSSGASTSDKLLRELSLAPDMPNIVAAFDTAPVIKEEKETASAQREASGTDKTSTDLQRASSDSDEKEETPEKETSDEV